MEDEEGRIRPDLAAFNLKQDREASEVVLIYLKRQRHKTRTEWPQSFSLNLTTNCVTQMAIFFIRYGELTLFSSALQWSILNMYASG